ncbi:MAG: hydrolase [Pseudomonadota bacterium]
MNAKTQPFRAAKWLSNRHIQTLLPSLKLVRAPVIAWRREVFELPDTDTVALDWNDLPDGVTPTALLVVLHGLEGSSESSYARGLAEAAARRGWLSVVLHARDCGGHPNRLSRRYHAGETADPGSVFAALVRRYPGLPLLACGYSLGGNTLLKYLGESGKKHPVKAAVAVSVPFDLQGASDSISRGFSKLYQWHLMRNMKKSLVRKFSEDTELFDWQRAIQAKRFEEFDDAVTAPLHGFDGKDHYYGSSSSKQFLKSIETPTTIIHAVDDPFIDPKLLPSETEASDCVTLEFPANGGHVGFVEGPLPGRLRFWLPERICEHFERMTQSTEAAD